MGDECEDVLHVEVYYDEGGANFFYGGADKRGYWVSMNVKQHHPDGIIMQALGPGAASMKFFIQPAARFNAGVFARVEVPADKLMSMREQVLARRKGAGQ